MPYDYERVYGVTFYHDGVWRGAADFEGQPHAFEIVGDPDASPAMYRLSPLIGHALDVAKELWDAGFTWNRSAGRSKHDRSPRVDELHELLESLLFIDEASCVRALGHFRPQSAASNSLQFPEVEVKWRRSP